MPSRLSRGDRVVLTDSRSGVSAGTKGVVLEDEGYFGSDVKVAFEGKGEKTVSSKFLQRL